MLQRCEENLGNETAATESSRCCGFTEFRGKQGLSWPNPSKKKVETHLEFKIMVINFLIPFPWATLKLSKHMQKNLCMH